MVAVAGRGWRLAPSLVALINETDRLYPNRSTASDGSIGDTAHAARTSDHNPAYGWVTAIDLTDDKAHGCDADRLGNHLIATRDPRVKYVIRNREIAGGYTGWRWRRYTGSNAHFSHTHISIHNTATARNDLRRWWPRPTTAPPPPPPTEEIEMIIVACTGKPTRLLAPPTCAVIDGATVTNLNRAGVRIVAYEADDYEALLDHINKALA